MHSFLLLIFFIFLNFRLSGADITATLDTLDGSSGFVVKGSDNVEVGRIDSNGNLVFTGGLRLDSGGIKCATAEMLIVDGSIGLKTASPEHTMQIGDSSGTVSVCLRGPDGNTESSALVFEDNGGKGSRWFKLVNDTDANILKVSSPEQDPIMAFTRTTGYVGIGTPAPASRLTVAGTVECTSGAVKFPDGSRQTMSGKVINVTYHVSTARSAMADVSSNVLETFNVNKKSSTSNLICMASISGYHGYSGGKVVYWLYGSAAEVGSQAHDYNTYFCGAQSLCVVSGYTTTGTQQMRVRFLDSANYRPFNVYNPNLSDYAGTNQTSSVYVVWEVEPN
ncbi:MAG: hypothetical protein PHQ23_03190 [Candidatus Wallbacteria bacterium]|nr:hypothetical protein [Candidatus Wallbacteria bacterium]